jgi:hypothetical protein
MSHALRIREFHVELGRDQHRDERALRERPANPVQVIRGKPPRHFRGERPHAARPRTQRLEIEPEIGVVPGFELEMSAPAGDQSENLVSHVANRSHARR